MKNAFLAFAVAAALLPSVSLAATRPERDPRPVVDVVRPDRPERDVRPERPVRDERPARPAR